MNAQTITLIGINRTTLSIGLALRKTALGARLVGFDFDSALTQQAKDEVNAIDKAEWNLNKAVAQGDILLLNLPQQEVESVMQAMADDVQPHALVLDLSPLKGRGLALAQKHLSRGHYVGVQPVLAAAHLADGRADLTLATADMFQNSVFCLMPGVQADPRAVETAVNFGRLLGATPYFLDPQEYDGLMQGIETMPSLLAAALFNTLYAATGWRDMLRFASLPVALTTSPLQAGSEIAELALHSSETSLRWLDAIIHDLQEMRRLIQDKERETLEATFVDLQAKRAQWLRERAKNDWHEAVKHDIQRSSFAEQMLGSWIARRGKEEN